MADDLLFLRVSEVRAAQFGGVPTDEAQTIDLGIMKVGLYAAIGFIAVIVLIIVGIIAGIVLKRKKMYRKLMAERQSKQSLR